MKASVAHKDQREVSALPRKYIQLRVPTDLLEHIDRALRRRPVPPSRHAWILEAIHEKLHKDKRIA
jgi:hypothetical protein